MIATRHINPKEAAPAPYWRVAVLAVLAALGVIWAGARADAQDGWDIYVYSGFQTALPSDVSGTDETGTPFDFNVAWEGRSLEAPPYYGARVMRETGRSWAVGLEFTHAKIYGDDEALNDNGFPRLEFTDGHNILTANVQRDFFESGRWTARGGIGLGVAIPYVEVTTPGGGETLGLELTGPAARWYLGADYALTDRWSVFAEYNGTYSRNTATLEGGGSLDTNVLTNALNLGIGFSF